VARSEKDAGRPPALSSANVILDVDKVVAAMDRRCLNASKLALAAGVSSPVITRVLRAKPIQRHKAALVVKAIIATPEVEGMGDFLTDD